MYKNYSELGIQETPHQDQYAVVEIANDQDKQKILSENRLVLIDIFADWCGPCKQTAGSYSVIAQNYSRPGVCAVVKHNYDVMSPQERQKLQIHAIPVFLFYLDGRVIDNVIGGDIASVEEKLKTHLQKLGSSQFESKIENTSAPQMYKSSIRTSRPQSQGVSNLYDGPSEPNPYNQPGPMYNPYQSQYHQFSGGK